MANFSKELSQLLSILNTSQLQSFAQSLKLEDIKLLKVSLLSNIENLALQQAVERALTNQEDLLSDKAIVADDGHMDSSSVMAQPHRSISERIQSIYEQVAVETILHNLDSKPAIDLFVKEASQQQLAFLNQALDQKSDDERYEYLLKAIDTKRKDNPMEAMQAYRQLRDMSRQKDREDKSWQAGIWLNINSAIKKANYQARLQQQKQAREADTSSAQTERQPRAYEVTFDDEVVSAVEFDKNGNRTEVKTSEKELLKNAKVAGAIANANDIGRTNLDQTVQRSRFQIEETIQARFGMGIAQQMVAASENGSHGKLMRVHESLLHEDDTNDVNQSISEALHEVTRHKGRDYLLNVTSNDTTFAYGGKSYLVTQLEAEVLDKLVPADGTENAYGIELSEAEKENLRQYQANMKRGSDLSNITRDFIWAGPYKMVGRDIVEIKGEKGEKKRVAFEAKITAAGKLLQKQCMELKDGEAITLDTGLHEHAMQLVIKREEGQYKLTTYDSGGGLERSSLSSNKMKFPNWIWPKFLRGIRVPSLLGIFKLWRMGAEAAVTKNAYSIKAPRENLESKKGLAYLTNLLRSNTSVGWAEQLERCPHAKRVSRAEQSNMNAIQRLWSLHKRSEIYMDYKERFASINPDAEPYFEEEYQRPQNTSNCFAKKAQACELYELGRPAYKKLRLAVLKEHRHKLIEDATQTVSDEEAGDMQMLPSKYRDMVESQKPEVLSPEELLEVSTTLSELKSPPSPEYYQTFYNALLESRQNLSDLNNDPKEYYQRLYQEINVTTVSLEEALERDNESDKRALKKANRQLRSVAIDYYNHLHSTGQQDVIAEVFDPSVPFIFDQAEQRYVCAKDTTPFKTENGKISAQILDKVATYKASVTTTNKEANTLAISRIDDKLKSHARRFFDYLNNSSPPRTEEISKYFDVTRNNEGEVIDVFIKMKGREINPEAFKELCDFSAACSWKASIQMLDHQIGKLDVKERFLNTEHERIPAASSRQALSQVNVTDLEQANVVRFNSGATRKPEVRIEVNIDGVRKEINTDTYFKLLVKHKEHNTLTDPGIMKTMDYLRNADPVIEASYKQIVYEDQVQAFKSKLYEHIQKSINKLDMAIHDLDVRKEELNKIVATIETSISDIEAEIKVEKARIRGTSSEEVERKSTKLQNLVSQLQLLQGDKAQITDLLNKVDRTKSQLNAQASGSPKARIFEAGEALAKLQGGESLTTINQFVREFSNGQDLLTSVSDIVDKSYHTIRVSNVGEAVKQRVERVNEFRASVINNTLLSNVEYHILHELSLGRFGKEKDRNKDMYRQSQDQRVDFIRKGNYSFAPGSVYSKIQKLNKALMNRVQDSVLQQVIAQDDMPYKVEDASIQNQQDKYQKIREIATAQAGVSLPAAIKQEWVKGMFEIWLAHTPPDQRAAIESKYDNDPAKGVNHAFHKFLADNTKIKYATLKRAGYPIELDEQKLADFGWQKVTDKQVALFQEKADNAARILQRQINSAVSAKEPRSKPKAKEVLKFEAKDLRAKSQSSAVVKKFKPLDVRYFSHEDRDARDGSTFDFLKDNPIPAPTGVSPTDCNTFYRKAQDYLAAITGQSR